MNLSERGGPTLARRERRRRRLSATPPPQRTKLPFPVNLIWNVKVFYVVFIGVMILSLAAIGLAPGLGSTGGGSRSTAPIDDEALPEETPVSVMAFEAPEPTIDAIKPHKAIIRTNEGDIVIALNPDAPKAANSFAFLAGSGFYDGLEFFWVYSDTNGGYSAQAGDPTCAESGEFSCTGTGGPGYTLPNESDSTEAGQWTVIAPVVTPGGDQVHGSQFVIALRDGVKAEGSVIGEVVEGQEILESLQQRVPCFGAQPSESNPCQTGEQLPPPLTIEDVIVQPA